MHRAPSHHADLSLPRLQTSYSPCSTRPYEDVIALLTPTFVSRDASTDTGVVHTIPETPLSSLHSTERETLDSQGNRGLPGTLCGRSERAPGLSERGSNSRRSCTKAAITTHRVANHRSDPGLSTASTRHTADESMSVRSRIYNPYAQNLSRSRNLGSLPTQRGLCFPTPQQLSRGRQSNTSRPAGALAPAPATTRAGAVCFDGSLDHPFYTPNRQRTINAAGGQEVVVVTCDTAAVPAPVPPRPGGWEQWVHAERAAGAMSVALARALFRNVIAVHPSQRLMAGSGPPSMRLLASRAAVSCLLLEKVVESLPRHERTIAPFVQAFIDSVFVTPTPELCEVLGSLEWPELLHGLHEQIARRMRWDHSSTIDSMPPLDYQVQSGSVTATMASQSAVGTNTPEMLLENVSRYARKTFFMAHMEITRLTTALAHEVRCRRMHFHRLPAILSLTQTSWTKRLLRTVLRVWAKLCEVRRVQLQRLRARWANRWSLESQRIGIRRWRGYAIYTQRTTQCDLAAKALIKEKRERIVHYLGEVDKLEQRSAELCAQLDQLTTAHQQMETDCAGVESRYTEALERVRDMDCTGTLLLSSLLIHEPVPANATDPAMMSVAIRSNAQVHDYMCAITDMVAWAGSIVCGSQEGRLIEQMCAMTPRQLERVQNELQKKSRHTLDSLEAATAVTTVTSPLPPESASSKPMDLSGSLRIDTVSELDASALKVLNEEFTAFEELIHPSTGMVLIPLYKFLVLMRCIAHDDSHAPSVETVRMVKTADSAVMEDLRRALTVDLDTSAIVERDDDTAQHVGALSEEMRATAADVCRIVVDSYGRLTGTASVVPAEALLERQRSPLLVFLASLLRYYTNWMHGKADLDLLQHEDSGSEPSQPTSSHSSLPSFLKLGRANLLNPQGLPQHMGKRHVVYPEWHTPPHSHLSWPAMLANQRQWIAFSMSALHRAVDIATQPTSVLNLEEHDLVATSVKQLAVHQLEDIMGAPAEYTASLYMRLMDTLSSQFRRIRFIYQLYATSLSRVRTMRTLTAATRRFSSLREGGNGDAEPGTATPSVSEQLHTANDDCLLSANAFWHLLCDAGVAGKRKSDATPHGSTLHRAAVMSIVEHVVFHTLSTRAEDRRELPGQLNRTTLRKPAVTRVPQVGQARIFPCFARAVQSEQHVDLRYDRATMCMTLSQFMEALLRCAQAWQAFQANSTPAAAPARSSLSEVMTTPSVSAAAMSRNLSSSIKKVGIFTTKTSVPPTIRAVYESPHYGVPIEPQVLHIFLTERLMPSFLGTPSESRLSTFRRNCRRTAVQELLAVHQDTLHGVFSQFAKPREALGIHGALPPPYAGVIATRASNRRLHGNSSLISTEAPSLTSCGGSATPQGSQSSLWGMRDVGIVAVLVREDIRAMAQALHWWHVTEGMLLTSAHHVRADPDREGEAVFFTEFLDFVCAIAEYTMPNPLMPLEKKVEAFLTNHILNNEAGTSSID